MCHGQIRKVKPRSEPDVYRVRPRKNLLHERNLACFLAVTALVDTYAINPDRDGAVKLPEGYHGVVAIGGDRNVTVVTVDSMA